MWHKLSLDLLGHTLWKLSHSCYAFRLFLRTSLIKSIWQPLLGQRILFTETGTSPGRHAGLLAAPRHSPTAQGLAVSYRTLAKPVVLGTQDKDVYCSLSILLLPVVLNNL